MATLAAVPPPPPSKPSGKKQQPAVASRWRIVVYKLGAETEDWVGMSGGKWTELQLVKDRFLCSVDGRRLFDEPIQGCTFTLTSSAFGELETGGKLETFGLYFATDKEAESVAETYAAKKERRPSLTDLVSSAASFLVGSRPPSTSSSRGEKKQQESKKQGMRLSASEALQKLDLSSEHDTDESSPLKVLHRRLSMSVNKLPDVENFSHKTHVTFNKELARYEGLPKDWMHVNQQFGIELHRCPRVKVEGCADRIPAVLAMLHRKFISLEGTTSVGVFRLAPDKEDCTDAKKAINMGQNWEQFCEVNVVANLIKIWFRELAPRGLLNTVTEQHLLALAENAIPPEKVLATMDLAHRALLLWLLDLMSSVTLNEAVNRMSPVNMAIVFSPNLYSTQLDNPMAALTMAQKIADATTTLLKWRLTTHHPEAAKAAAIAAALHKDDKNHHML